MGWPIHTIQQSLSTVFLNHGANIVDLKVV